MEGEGERETIKGVLGGVESREEWIERIRGRKGKREGGGSRSEGEKEVLERGDG